MSNQLISFLTPYLSGSEMMRIHLESIRQFHSDAPILVSKKGGDAQELEKYRTEFGICYWLEDCKYEEALLRLLQRCKSEYVCILDHDTVLLSSINPLLSGLELGRYDLVGIEERIRVPDEIWKRLWPTSGGWLRFSPGYMDATFLIFNLHAFVRKWGLEGLRSKRVPPFGYSWEAHYGLCEKLTRHHYLRPYHTSKYGMGNIIMDGDTVVVWHQWYGSYSARLVGAAPELPDPFNPSDSVARPVIEKAERTFLEDYPNLDFSDLAPAWAPKCNIFIECLAVALRELRSLTARTILRWRNYGLRGYAARVLARIKRWARRGA